jgi:hypothetical protein
MVNNITTHEIITQRVQSSIHLYLYTYIGVVGSTPEDYCLIEYNAL